MLSVYFTIYFVRKQWSISIYIIEISTKLVISQRLKARNDVWDNRKDINMWRTKESITRVYIYSCNIFQEISKTRSCQSHVISETAHPTNYRTHWTVILATRSHQSHVIFWLVLFESHTCCIVLIIWPFDISTIKCWMITVVLFVNQCATFSDREWITIFGLKGNERLK